MFGRCLADGVGSQTLHHKRQIGERGRIGECFANQTEGAHVQFRAGRRDGIMQRACFRQHADEFAQLGVDVALFDRARLNFVLDKRLNVGRQVRCSGVKKGSCSMNLSIMIQYDLSAISVVLVDN